MQADKLLSPEFQPVIEGLIASPQIARLCSTWPLQSHRCSSTCGRCQLPSTLCTEASARVQVDKLLSPGSSL